MQRIKKITGYSVQACLVLRYFFLSHLRDHFQFNSIWHRRYAIIFGVTLFGIQDPWSHLSCHVLEASRNWHHCTPPVTHV